jgi:hypothetical protein
MMQEGTTITLTVKDGRTIAATVAGRVDLSKAPLTGDEMARIPDTEAFLERLTGFRFHIATTEPRESGR